MSNVELLSFTDAQALAQAAANQWVKALERQLPREAPFCVALSGGRIARRFFEAVVCEVKHRSCLAFNSVHFFWADERCVPPQDPESNFGLACRTLFAPLHTPESNIHRVRGEDQPELAATQAEAQLRRVARVSVGRHSVLDLIFLGMGEDGHVASLFPVESAAAMTPEASYRAVSSPKPPPWRITLGYQAIAVASEVWVLASGEGKENALRESLAPGGGTPLARVLSLRTHTKIFTDIRK